MKYCASELALRAVQLSRNQKLDPSMRIFEQTNEHLTHLFNTYDVRNKDVLTVLASSDQLFSCYYKKAKSIDTFDKSYLTLYYYYLRKWLILYRNQFYPSYRFFYDGDIDLYYLICMIHPMNIDEKNAQVFWKTYLENHRKRADKYLFHLSNYTQPKPFEHDIEGIKPIFNHRLHFYCVDLFKKIPIKKKYDVLILSNMLEYSTRKEELIQARNNIEALLKDDGIAVCTYMINDRTSMDHLNEIGILTSNQLSVESQVHTYYEALFGANRDLAYSYQKKKMK